MRFLPLIDYFIIQRPIRLGGMYPTKEMTTINTGKFSINVCWSNIIIYDCFSNLFIKVKKIRTHIQCHISAIHQRENG